MVDSQSCVNWCCEHSVNQLYFNKKTEAQRIKIKINVNIKNKGGKAISKKKKIEGLHKERSGRAERQARGFWINCTIFWSWGGAIRSHWRNVASGRKVWEPNSTPLLGHVASGTGPRAYLVARKGGRRWNRNQEMNLGSCLPSPPGKCLSLSKWFCGFL